MKKAQARINGLESKKVSLDSDKRNEELEAKFGNYFTSLSKSDKNEVLNQLEKLYDLEDYD